MLGLATQGLAESSLVRLHACCLSKAGEEWLAKAALTG